MVDIKELDRTIKNAFIKVCDDNVYALKSEIDFQARLYGQIIKKYPVEKGSGIRIHNNVRLKETGNTRFDMVFLKEHGDDFNKHQAFAVMEIKLHNTDKSEFDNDIEKIELFKKKYPESAKRGYYIYIDWEKPLSKRWIKGLDNEMKTFYTFLTTTVDDLGGWSEGDDYDKKVWMD